VSQTPASHHTITLPSPPFARAQHDNVEERGTTNNHAARLMKNKEDIDVQSNYHEEEIGETVSE
jgi:hypothetical protein